jgi:hypothetical protein
VEEDEGGDKDRYDNEGDEDEREEEDDEEECGGCGEDEGE